MTPLPPAIVNTIPPKWLVYATAAWLLLQNAGRVYQALRNGGGLRGIWRGVMYGANVPAAPDPAKKLETPQGQEKV